MFNDNIDESLAQIEQTMKAMISMAQNGHFPFLKSIEKNTRESLLTAANNLSLISPHQSKKILYKTLVKCRKQSCFSRKISIMEDMPFESKAILIKALITLAEDQSLTEKLVIH